MTSRAAAEIMLVKRLRKDHAHPSRTLRSERRVGDTLVKENVCFVSGHSYGIAIYICERWEPDTDPIDLCNRLMEEVDG